MGFHLIQPIDWIPCLILWQIEDIEFVTQYFSFWFIKWLGCRDLHLIIDKCLNFMNHDWYQLWFITGVTLQDSHTDHWGFNISYFHIEPAMSLIIIWLFQVVMLLSCFTEAESSNSLSQAEQEERISINLRLDNYNRIHSRTESSVSMV